MANVLGRSLSGKSVMTSGGSEIGTLHNITMDISTGNLNNLIVVPSDDLKDRRQHGATLEQDERGRYRIPAERVEAVKDYVILG